MSRCDGCVGGSATEVANKSSKVNVIVLPSIEIGFAGGLFLCVVSP